MMVTLVTLKKVTRSPGALLKFQVDAGGHTPEHHFKTRLKKIKHRLIRPLFGNMDIKVSNSSNVK